MFLETLRRVVRKPLDCLDGGRTPKYHRGAVIPDVLFYHRVYTVCTPNRTLESLQPGSSCGIFNTTFPRTRRCGREKNEKKKK